jgi:peptide-methionine (S)-S-oxide reductase
MKKILLLFSLSFLFFACADRKATTKSEVKNSDSPMSENVKTAVFGAGCFWCVEAIFQNIEGVEKVEPGYSGGQIKDPTYKMVCYGNTGHAEVAKIWYNPDVISFETLLEVFWHTHNPTTLNKQGGDEGTQYRSAIFYETDQEKEIAEASLKKTDASGLWEDPIVTEVSPLINYYAAEDYHKNYYLNNSNQPYCAAVIAPKIRKLRTQCPGLLKE